MHPRIHFIAIFLLAALFSACGGSEKNTYGTSADSSATVQSTPPEIWLEIRYDDLRLRETPSMEGKVLATLKTGDRVKDLGEASPALETVVLRQERITAPWGKVETKDGQQGWIFLGALGPVRDPAVDSYKKSLSGIKGKDCKVIQQAIQKFSEHMKGKPAHVADQAVVELDHFIDSVVTNLNDALFRSEDLPEFEKVGQDEDGRSKKPAVQKKIDQWAECGLHLEFPEGMPTIYQNPGLTNLNVEPMVTPEMRTFLNQRKKEWDEGWSVDAGLVITPQQLAERAVFWDDFVSQHPTFVYAPELRRLAYAYTTDLLTGQNNTPALGYEDGKLEDDFKAAYDWVLKEHPKSETAHWVQEWTDILKANGWKRSTKSDAYTTKLYQ
jgi:hypothetical protein